MSINSAIIERSFQENQALQGSSDVAEQVEQTISALNSGELRVAEKSANGEWVVNDWVQKAILLYFKKHQSELMSDGLSHYFDKIPLKYANHTSEQFGHEKTRVVPSALVRYGAYVGKHTILMPSYVNIGAYVDDGTLVDTWATVGSCAQIGKNVHLSGGAGIGGVLEPAGSVPVIIEDNCFIGARSEIVEGVRVGENAVISMGVYIGQSTKIYHRQTGEITSGYVPPNAVVVPGSMPAKDGSHSLNCAVIVKEADFDTRDKVKLNKLLRDLD